MASFTGLDPSHVGRSIGSFRLTSLPLRGFGAINAGPPQPPPLKPDVTSMTRALKLLKNMSRTAASTGGGANQVAKLPQLPTEQLGWGAREFRGDFQDA